MDQGSPTQFAEENGFEHVNPTSTFADTTGDQAEEDLYTASSPVTSSSEAEAVQQEPLINLGDTPVNEEPPSMPESSSTVYEPTPVAEPAPVAPPRTSSKEETVNTSAETFAAGACFNSWVKSFDPRVVDLVYWRDVKKTGVVFGSLMFVLLSFSFFSLISVFSYLSLAALTVTFSFKVYKNVVNAVQKSGEGDPFKEFLDMDVTLPVDRAHDLIDTLTARLNPALVQLRDLFLVKDLVESIKFGLLLWVLTYIGAWFNGLTLILLVVLGAFTVPKVYETHQAVIDQYLSMAVTQVKKVYDQVRAKIPFPKQKPKTKSQ